MYVSTSEVYGPMGEDPLFEHLLPRPLKNRNDVLRATLDIEMSFTGRMDMMSLNVFFMESSKKLRNAVKLFEEGVFDAAFYAVRSAAELARVVTYFSGCETPTDNDEFASWKCEGRFPFDSEVCQKLEKVCAPYREVRDAIPEFFDERKAALKRVNKYIHRQGFRTFYTFSPVDADRHVRRMDAMAGEFHSFIMGAVAEIIMLRLSVDPYPMLLRDPDVMYRIRNISFSKPLSDDVVGVFLTPKIVDAYRSTGFYGDEAARFRGNEPFNKAAYNLFNFGIYSRAEGNDVRRQFQLLTVSDRVAALVFDMLPDATYLVANSGFNLYWADNAGLEGGFSTDFRETGRYGEVPDFTNRPDDRGYATRVKIRDDYYVVHHLNPLSNETIGKLEVIDPG